MTRYAWIITVVGAVVIVSGTLAYRYQAASRPAQPAARPDLSHIGGGFTLQGTDGAEVRLKDFRGQAVLLYFGYATCPDVCPTTLSLFKQTFARLGEAGDEVQVLFVTVDPERDTPERMRSFVRYFHPDFRGLTGTPEQIRTVADRYKAAYMYSESESAAGYQVSHTDIVYLIDRQGRTARLFSSKTAPDELAAAVRDVLEG